MKLLLIGASAGSVDIIEKLLHVVPKKLTALFAIHMRAPYIYGFVELLRKNCLKEVRLLKEFEPLEHGVYICDTTYSTIDVCQGNGSIYVRYNTSESSIYRPDIDYLFKSVARMDLGKDVCAMLLSGIGEEGAEGLGELKRSGAFTMVLDEDTAPIYGIPKAAIERDAHRLVVDIGEVERLLQRFVNGELSWED